MLVSLQAGCWAFDSLRELTFALSVCNGGGAFLDMLKWARILIIEDELLVAWSLRDVLSPLDFFPQLAH